MAAPVRAQGAFAGSDRQWRGRILRALRVAEGAVRTSMLVAGLAAAMPARNLRLSMAIADGGRGGTVRFSLSRRLLVVAQIGLAFVLFNGAALLTATLRELGRVDPGYRVDEVMTASTYVNTADVRQQIEGARAGYLVRNPDAMLLLAKMKETNASAFDRAMGVSIYLITFGRFLSLPREQLDLLGMLGLLQDIGKLRLPG